MFDGSGHVTGLLQDARGYTNEDFQQAWKDGSIAELASSLPVEQEVLGKNQLLYPYNGKLFNRQFGAPGTGGQATADGGYFARVYLGTDTSQKAWTDWEAQGFIGVWSSGHVSQISTGDTKYTLAVQSNGAVEPYRITEESNTPTGLRAIHITHSWLWLPSEANVSNIRTVRIVGLDTTNMTATGGEFVQTYMHHRFVDSGGNAITITKNSTQTFMVRWKQTFKSI